MSRRLSNFIAQFRKTRELVWKLYYNELKNPDRLGDKNRVEGEFYDRQADELAGNFNPKELHIMPDNETPASYRFMFSLLTGIAGKRVLDCCCGFGSMSVYCALQGATVVGIDISEKMLELARKNVRAYRVSGRVHFEAMPVEKMRFRAGEFDLVIGIGALHHLQPEMAAHEISRILKKGGRAIFVEPFGNSRFITSLRSLIPVACFESPGGGTLRFRDMSKFEKYFTKIELNPFNLLSRMVRFTFFVRFWILLDRIDSHLFKVFPALRWFASAGVLQFYR